MKMEQECIEERLTSRVPARLLLLLLLLLLTQVLAPLAQETGKRDGKKDGTGTQMRHSTGELRSPGYQHTVGLQSKAPILVGKEETIVGSLQKKKQLFSEGFLRLALTLHTPVKRHR